MISRDKATKQLFDAISNDDINKIKTALFDSADVNGTVKGTNGTPLFKAAGRGNLSIIKLLLENDADIHATVTNGTRDIFNGAGVIESAVDGNHLEVVRFLLERGANANQVRQDGYSPLSVAANDGSTAIAKILLEHGARIDQFGVNGYSPLTIAVVKHRVDTVKLFVAHILSTYKNKPKELLVFLNTHDQFKTAITYAQHSAIINEIMRLIDTLLESGMDHENIRALLPPGYNFKNFNMKERILDRIQSLPANERISLCSKILTEPNHPYRVIFSMQRGGNPCQLGHGVLKRVKTTMDAARAKKAEVNQASSWYKGMTPLYYAADKGHIEVAKKLIHDGANCNPANVNENPLFAAAKHGNIDMVNLLVDNGANPAVSTKTTKAALWKLFTSQESFVKDALTNFLQRFPGNEVTITPTDYAAIFGFADTVELFNALCDQEPALTAAQTDATVQAASVVAAEVAQPASLQEQEDQQLAAAIKASLAPTEVAQPESVANSNNEPLQEKPAAATIAHQPVQRLASQVEIAAAIPAPAATVTEQPKSGIYKEAYAVMNSDAANFAAAVTSATPQQVPAVEVAAPAAPKVNVMDLLFADSSVSTLSTQTLQPAAVQIAKPVPVVAAQPAVGELISLTAAPAVETTAIKPESDIALKLFSIFAETAPAPAPAQPVAAAAPQTENLGWLDELENLNVPTKTVQPEQQETTKKKKTNQLVLG